MFGSLWLILLNNLKTIRCFLSVKKKRRKRIKIYAIYKKKIIGKNSNNIFYCIFWFVIKKKTPEGELSIDRIEVNFSFSLQNQKRYWVICLTK